MQIIGIAGSLRRGSLNAALLRAAAGLAPEGASIKVGSIAGIPLYDGDLEAAEGVPAAVAAFKEAIASADGLLLATPEYNNGIPGVFKNAIDWASRPASDIPRVFGGKPAALMGATPGAFGTLLSQSAWLSVLRTLGCQTWNGGRMLLPAAHKAFDDNGELTDPATRQRLRRFMEGFAAFAEKNRGRR